MAFAVRAARSVIIATFCCSFNVRADELPLALRKSLNPYAIASSTIEGGVLKIVVNWSTVTAEAHKSIVLI